MDIPTQVSTKPVGSSISDSIYNTVHPIAQQYGVPDYVWISIVEMESGGNPKALASTSKEYSVGLFQLNTKGGQGSAYSKNPDALYDPSLNAQIGLKPIADAYKKAKAQGMTDSPELAGWVAGHSGHNGYNVDMDAPIIQKVIANAKKLTGSISGTMGEIGAGIENGVDTVKNILDPKQMLVPILRVVSYVVVIVVILFSLSKIWGFEDSLKSATKKVVTKGVKTK